jgi:hypothetical protein
VCFSFIKNPRINQWVIVSNTGHNQLFNSYCWKRYWTVLSSVERSLIFLFLANDWPAADLL